MEKEKKKWETPKLICLCRGRPEEVVLTACKGALYQGPQSTDYLCTNPQGTGKCSQQTLS